MGKKSSGYSGQSFEQIMMSQAFKQVESPVYCTVCGGNVKDALYGNENLEWEVYYHLHTRCANASRR